MDQGNNPTADKHSVSDWYANYLRGLGDQATPAQWMLAEAMRQLEGAKEEQNGQ